MKMGFCVSGGGRTVEAILEARRAGLLMLPDPCALLDRETGFVEIAAKYDLPLKLVPRRPEEHREAYRERLSEAIASLPVEGLFLSFDWMLPRHVVHRFNAKIINLHMGLLPLFPGRGAIAAALSSGMSFAGATVHLVDEGMDTGPIIGQATTPIVYPMTDAQLGRALFKAAAPMCIQAVRWLERGHLGTATGRRVVVSGASYGEGNFSPLLDRDIAEFALEFLANRYPN